MRCFKDIDDAQASRQWQWAEFYDLFCHKPYEEGVDAGIKGVFDSTGDVDHINAASNNDREQRLGLAYLRQTE